MRSDLNVHARRPSLSITAVCAIAATAPAVAMGIGRNIRVNAVSPGVIETPLFGKLGLSEASLQDLGKALLQPIPAKRFGKPEEVATAVTFLASGDASYIF
jgi:NAD(P)-dependent dehydrogenase (short-subunit alcohol dehydrogenase family)